MFLEEFYKIFNSMKVLEPLLHSFLLLFHPLPFNPVTTYIEDLLISGSAFIVVEIHTKGTAYDVGSFNGNKMIFSLRVIRFLFFQAYTK